MKNGIHLATVMLVRLRFGGEADAAVECRVRKSISAELGVASLCLLYSLVWRNCSHGGVLGDIVPSTLKLTHA